MFFHLPTHPPSCQPCSQQMPSISKWTEAGLGASPHGGLVWGLGSGPSSVPRKIATEHGVLWWWVLNHRFIKVWGCDDYHWACLSSEKRAWSDKKPHLTIISFHVYLFLSTCCSKKKHSVPFSVNLIPVSQLFLHSHISIAEIGNWMEV